MAVWKVIFVSCLLVLAVSAQDKNKKTETRGHFGGGRPGAFGGGGPGGNFGGGGGGYGGNVGGGFPAGAVGGFGPGVGGFPGGGNFHQGGGINQPFPAGGGIGGIGGQGGLGGHGSFVQPGGFPGGHVGGASGGIGSSNCRYWCKTPEGQAYCCENNQQAPKHPVAAIIQKPGLCPPVRAECPLRIFGGPPQTCSKHGDCYGTERCCFDRCLNEHVCKESQYS